MAISVADNFSYQGGKPLDARMKYDSVANMVAVPAANLYDGCFAYVTAEQKYYSYDSANDTDPTLGKWREYSGGGGGDVDPMPAEDMDEILTPLPGVMARSIYNSRFNRSDMYDTNEVLIGKWIDGKPLYQKTYTELNIAVDKESWASNCLSVPNGDKIIDLKAYYADAGTVMDMTSCISCSEIYNEGLNLYSLTGVKTSSSKNINVITIQYTKTTDGTTKVDFDTDYSTDETIVGRWIDGKPLYQKTINFGALPNNETKEVAHGISNIDFVSDIKGTSIRPSDGNVISLPDKPLTDLWIKDGNIYIKTDADRSAYTKTYVTLQYTKTTD